MAGEPKQFVLTLGGGPEADDEELAQLGRQLRTELLQLNVEAADPMPQGGAPAGSKGDPVALATLAVTLAPLAMTEVMKAVQAWLTRHDRASVTVESGADKITITGSPSKEQQRALEAFITRHKT